MFTGQILNPFIQRHQDPVVFTCEPEQVRIRYLLMPEYPITKPGRGQ